MVTRISEEHIFPIFKPEDWYSFLLQKDDNQTVRCYDGENEKTKAYHSLCVRKRKV
jgi:hypothetical protein